MFVMSAEKHRDGARLPLKLLYTLTMVCLISWTLTGLGKVKADGVSSATPFSVVPFCAILGQQYSPEPVCLLRLLNAVSPSTGFL